jgi:predicted TIM-barrel fold metal-dependent hydrolase
LNELLYDYRRLWEKYGEPDMNINEFAEKFVGSLAGNHHGVKLYRGVPFPKPSFEEAQAQFDHYSKNKTGSRDKASLYLLHQAIELCGKYNLPVAVHCGIIWECWQDFYGTSIEHIVQAAMTYRDTTFDIYHASIPWVREAGVAGNQYPNVNLNLTWTHEISHAMTISFLDEWIDLVPLNKIIGFGADSQTPFLTAGVRRRTFDNIAEVLSHRVAKGEMDMEEAKEICHMWLYNNPTRRYKL